MTGAEDDAEKRRQERREKAHRRIRNQRLVAISAALALVLFIGWFFGIRGGKSDSASTPDDHRTAATERQTGAGDQPTEAEKRRAEAERRRAERARRIARRHARDDRAIQRLLRHKKFIASGGGRKRQVALTFDDGPGPFTGRVLDILERTRTPATFFVVGSMIPGNEKLLRRIARQGHAIGNHTQSHPAMGDLDRAAQLGEMTAEAAAARAAGIRQHSLFRPPYRSFDRTTFDLLGKRDELMVLWSIDTEDYATSNPRKIARIVLREIKPGSIVLMHDAGGDREATVRALPKIIRGLRKRKLRPVTIPQLVADDPPRRRGDRYPEGL